MIYYGKLFDLMKEQGKNTTHIRNEKVVSQDTLGKIRKGTGIIDIGRDPNSEEKGAKKIRITSIDSKSIESLCTWLNCQPSDIMEIIPNRWENQDKLCEILNCTPEELPSKVPMEEN